MALYLMEKAFCVYMLASGRNGTLYIGVTSDLIQRIWQHKEGVAEVRAALVAHQTPD